MQSLAVRAFDDNSEHAIVNLTDRLEGKYPEKRLALMYGTVLPEPSESFFDVLEKYAGFNTSGYCETDHRMQVRLKKYKSDLLEVLGEYKLNKQPVQNITRRDDNGYGDTLLETMSPNSKARYKNTATQR